MSMPQRSDSEKLDIVYMKSLFDQVSNAYQQIFNLQQDLEILSDELHDKLSLTSRALDGPTTFTELGEGVVSAKGVKVTGVDTKFMRYVTCDFFIKIGAEVSKVERIISDTELYVTPEFTKEYQGVIYGVIRSGTAEVLKGDYHFGGERDFHGIIAKNSILEHYGRMSQPNDVVNVGFVEKALAPVKHLASRGISLDGDVVGIESGREEDQTSFTFNNCDFEFDEKCELTYNGVLPNWNDQSNWTPEQKTQFATVGFAQQFLNQLNDYSSQCVHWYSSEKDPDEQRVIDSANSKWVDGFGYCIATITPKFQTKKAFPTLENQKDVYFKIKDRSIEAQRPCTIVIDFIASVYQMPAVDPNKTVGLEASIYLKRDGMAQYDVISSHTDEGAASVTIPSTSTSCTLALEPGDMLRFCVNPIGVESGSGQIIRATLSLLTF